MSENEIFTEGTERNAPDKKPGHTTSLVVGIMAIVLGLLSAMAGEVLGVTGIVSAVANRKKCNVTPGLICSIVGLVLSLINHVLGILMTMGVI